MYKMYRQNKRADHIFEMFSKSAEILIKYEQEIINLIYVIKIKGIIIKIEILNII